MTSNLAAPLSPSEETVRTADPYVAAQLRNKKPHRARRELRTGAVTVRFFGAEMGDF